VTASMQDFTGKRGVNKAATEIIQKSIYVWIVFTLLTLHYVLWKNRTVKIIVQPVIYILTPASSKVQQVHKKLVKNEVQFRLKKYFLNRNINFLFNFYILLQMERVFMWISLQICMHNSLKHPNYNFTPIFHSCLFH
jgi:L-lactate permease